MLSYGAILHAPWSPGSKEGEIIGEWAEDSNPYSIIVPTQLRADIIELQNALNRKYYAVQTCRLHLAKLEADAKFDKPNDIGEGGK